MAEDHLMSAAGDDASLLTPDDPLALLRSASLFVGVPEDELHAVAERLEIQWFVPGSTIIREGEPGDACYIIRTGQAGVISTDLIGQEITLATFGPSACFGEVSLVTEGLRTATVRALEPVEAYVLHRADFNRLEATCPAFATRARHHVDVLAVDGFLRKASPFAHLPGEAIRRLAGQLQSQRAAAGEVIISEGEEGDRFYLLRRGRVEVLREGRRLQVLEAGDGFGEVALLADVKRTATVRALEDTELLTLTKADFTAVVEEHASLRRQFTEFIRIRVGDTLARTVSAADPFSTLMPDLPVHRRRRYWWLLIGGIGLFALLSWLAVRSEATLLVYAALLVGAFVGPLVYVTYLAESQLLPDRPLNLAITFLLAAGLGIPLAYYAETASGAHHGTLGSSFLVGLIEEPAKIIGVIWLLRRSSSRFQMDGVIYGAAAGMGFAAFESVLYGWNRAYDVNALLSTLWFRTLLSPFGHGTWTAIIAAAIWRRKGSGAARVDLPVVGAFAASVGLHTLWDWQPLQGVWLLIWLVFIGIVGLEILRTVIEQATNQAVGAVLALNPQAADATSEAPKIRCRVCGQESPPGTHYCVRCGAALRQTSAST